MEITNDHIKRFWEKVDKNGDGSCWIWIAGKTGHGYGALYINKDCKSYGAHRVSWIIKNGSIPGGLFVCHKCDNPACVNPDHLFLGTLQDNVQDMISKSRKPKGEDSTSSKITWDIVNQIRKMYQTGNFKQRELGARFGLDQTQVGHIVSNEQWIDENYKREVISTAHKMSLIKAQKVRWLNKVGFNQTQISKMFNVHKSLISLIIRNKIWRANNG